MNPARLLPVVLFLLVMAACDDDSPVAPVNPVEHHEVTLAETTAVIAAGGRVSLPNGMEITIDAGSSTLTLRQIGAERFFNAPNRNAYDIIAEPQPDRMTIRFPGTPGRDADHVGVFRYDLTSNTGNEQPFTYDPSTGTIMVVVTTSGTNGGRSLNAGAAGSGTRWVTEVDPLVTPTREVVEIGFPYYQQDDRTCWAATTKMFAAGYNNGTMTIVPDFLKNMGSDLSTGISHLKYWSSLPALLRTVTGKPVSALWCWRSIPAREKLVEQLDKGIPVSMALNLPDHSVVVIGYRRVYGQGAIPTYDFKVHDPSDPAEMNAWHPWSWFEARKPSLYSFQLIWPDVPPPETLPLQTIGLPLANTGSIRAVRTGFECDGERRIENVARLTFRSDAPLGYDFSGSGSAWVTPLAGNVSDVGIELPMWNSSTSSAILNIAIKLTRKGGTGFVYYEDLDTTLPARSATHDLIRFLPIIGPRPGEAPSGYMLTVEMWGGGRKLDFWSIEFSVSPPLPLIRSIMPCNGPWGTTVTIRGLNFGPSYDRNRCQVVFDRQPADVVARWDDSTIVTTVPQGATSGDLVVLFDGKASNGRFFEVDGGSTGYTMKSYSVSGEAFDGPLIFGGTLSGENMVIDDDSPTGMFQTIGFTVTGSPPATVHLNRTYTGSFKREYRSYFDTSNILWENITERQFAGWTLKVTKGDGTTVNIDGTDGSFALEMGGDNLKLLAPGIWVYTAELLFRYRQTFTIYAGGVVQDRSSNDFTITNLLLVGYVQQ